MTSTEWDTLRRNVRNIENELDQRISSYSKLASQLSTGYYSAQASSALKSSTEDARAMEGEISEMLESVGAMLYTIYWTLRPVTELTWTRHVMCMNDLCSSASW